jgi:glycosyltransferase involved in cell wall biosynthesis
MKTDSPVLTIAIPVFNEAAGLGRTLKSLEKLDVFESGKIRVLVQDNASTDESFEVAKQFLLMHPTRVQVARNPENLGFHGNLLALAKQSDSEFIWYLGAGEEIAVASLAPMIDFLAHPNQKDVKMGTVNASPSVVLPTNVSNALSWEIEKHKPMSWKCFRETISLNIVKTHLALEVLASSSSGTPVMRDSWPHLEMALIATASPSFSIISPGLVGIAENNDGWWYHSPIGMDVYLRQIALLKESMSLGQFSPWQQSLHKELTGWRFVAMAFEIRVNGAGYTKRQLDSASQLGLVDTPLVMAGIIRTLPMWSLLAAQSFVRRIRSLLGKKTR